MQTTSITLDGIGAVPLTYDDQGQGPTVLLLHGGGGPGTVSGFADLLAGEHGLRVLTPTHPGFTGTTRPESLHSIRDLARLYLSLLTELDLSGVTVVGNSIGGWIAAEMAVQADPRVARTVLLDAVGLVVPEDPIPDFFALTPAEVAERSWADPTGRALDPAAMPESQRAELAGNRAALETYGGHAMSDPQLRPALPNAVAPALVVWGAHDRIVRPAHGRVYAAEMANARFELIANSGHLPQLETPQQVADLVLGFLPGH